ncbi:hypothetical protein GGR53DRAFT_461626 [Hypoxylon sp. FL1150]|nr:hypothetical protein GGR53DRAFT_461626 [Hypoxylon sp. FL1150]
MATYSPPGADHPPPYVTGRRDDAEDIIQPVILIHVGHFIRAQSVDGTPLYQLSRDVRHSSTSEAQLAQVTLERLIHTVRTSSDGTPRTSQRSRNIFELKHLPSVLSTGFPYCLDAASRSVIGNLAIKSTSFPKPGLRVVKIKPERQDEFPKGYKARRESLKEAELVFEIVRKQGHYEWMSPEGARLAVEDETEDGVLARLVLMAPVTRKTMDAIIGSWCLRMWRASIKSARSSQNPRKSIPSIRVTLAACVNYLKSRQKSSIYQRRARATLSIRDGIIQDPAEDSGTDSEDDGLDSPSPSPSSSPASPTFPDATPAMTSAPLPPSSTEITSTATSHSSTQFTSTSILPSSSEIVSTSILPSSTQLESTSISSSTKEHTSTATNSPAIQAESPTADAPQNAVPQAQVSDGGDDTPGMSKDGAIAFGAIGGAVIVVALMFIVWKFGFRRKRTAGEGLLSQSGSSGFRRMEDPQQRGGVDYGPSRKARTNTMDHLMAAAYAVEDGKASQYGVYAEEQAAARRVRVHPADKRARGG